ncbi:hypothetical protein D3C72_485820 [compost metagenome]
MKELQVGNNLVALVDDDVYERVSGYVWVLSGGKPYLYVMQPSWEGSRSLHRHVMNEQDPNRWVVFKDGWFLNCQRSNLFVGTVAQCKAFRRLNPLPEPEVKTSTLNGVSWNPQVRAWTIAYEAYRLSNRAPQFFRDEDDGAREFDRLMMGRLDGEQQQVANLRIRLQEREVELADFRLRILDLLNFPAV